MKLWWLPPSVANTLIVSGTALALGSIWVTPAMGPPENSLRFATAVLGLGLGAGMIVNGIARSTRPPESPG